MDRSRTSGEWVWMESARPYIYTHPQIDELHLHYNTLSYRLQQLWLLLEADPVDPMKRLALETALYLYWYRRT